MKTKIYSATILITLAGFYYKTDAQANRHLSNLVSPTSVNVTLLPDLDHERALGSLDLSWSNLYLSGSVFLGDKRFLAYKLGTGDANTAVGSQVLNSNTSGYSNTGVGLNALFFNTEGFENTASGYHALYANTGGHANSAFGVSALAANTTGHYNTAIGNYAMTGNSTGFANVAIGISSLNANTIGNYNTAGGGSSLNINTIGNYNTAFGFATLNHNIRGNSNVAIGIRALYQNENMSNLVAVGDSALLNLNSYQCTAVGSHAGMTNTTGSKNTYLGYHAGITVTTGNANTIIGCNADVSSTEVVNAIAIGNAAIVNASNKVRIGNSSVTSIGGQVGWTNFSDERIKNNIQENVPGLKFINLLKPVTYHFDIDKEQDILQTKNNDSNGGKYDIAKIQFTGFLAQDVETAAKKIGYDFSGVDAPKNDKDLYGLRYAEFVVPLVKAVQELSKQNDELKSENDAQKKINTDLQKQIDELKAMFASGNSSNLSAVNGQQSTASLGQNIPNPFDHTTAINYSLPMQYLSAKIMVYDEAGKTIKSINLSGNGKGSINFSSPFRAGASYHYSLFVDEKLIGTRQMVSAK